MAAPKRSLSEAWLARLIGVAILVAAAVGAVVGVLPTIACVGVFLCIGGALWMDIAHTWPLRSFWLMLGLFVLLYMRMGLPIGGSNGGAALVVADFLWFGYVAIHGVSWVIRGRSVHARGLYAPLWAIVPYLILATILPVLGVSFGSWPVSFAGPGLRQIQWVSFALIAYGLGRRRGVKVITASMIRFIVLVGIVHMAYGVIQFLSYKGILGAAWVKLDALYGTQSGTPWSHRLRTTGLLTNPNAYGLFSASLLAILMAVRIVRVPLVSTRLSTIGFVAACFGLISSASRSSLLGVMMMFAFLAVLALYNRQIAARGLLAVLAVFIALLLVLPLFGDVLSDQLTSRFVRFADVLSEGADADPTAYIRQEEWGKLLYLYINQYPFGTWVPASYVMNSPVDSYYMVTLLQGTPFFTLLWIIFMLGAVDLGRRVYHLDSEGEGGVAGLIVGQHVGIMAGAGVGMSPMLQPQFVVVFWCFVGVAMLVINRELSRSNGSRTRD